MIFTYILYVGLLTEMLCSFLKGVFVMCSRFLSICPIAVNENIILYYNSGSIYAQA